MPERLRADKKQKIEQAHAEIIAALDERGVRLSEAEAQRLREKIAAYVGLPPTLARPIQNTSTSRRCATPAVGRLTMEMKAALLMADRTKAAEKEMRSEHIQITSLMNELIEAADKENDRDLVSFATAVAAHSLNEMEVLLPATIVIGDYLRAKLLLAQ